MLVFSQKPFLDPEALVRQAARHFDCDLVFDTSAREGDSLGLCLSRAAPFDGTFRVRCRPARAADQIGLDAAEAANGSFGMADLARRCGHVWELAVESGTSSASAYFMGAILASVALGPLLPGDRSGLFGVRSCRLRAEALAAG